MAFRHCTPQSKSGKQAQKKDLLLLSQDASWLSTLSEPELDLLISLKELAIMRSKFAGHRELANKFDPRMLRALGVILLEHFKEKLKSIPNHAMDADLIDKLPLLSIGLPVNVPNSTPSFASLKRKNMHDGLDNNGAQSSKKQNIKLMVGRPPEVAFWSKLEQTLKSNVVLRWYNNLNCLFRAGGKRSNCLFRVKDESNEAWISCQLNMCKKLMIYN